MFALSSSCLEANTEEEQGGRFLFERRGWEDTVKKKKNTEVRRQRLQRFIL